MDNEGNSCKVGYPMTAIYKRKISTRDPFFHDRSIRMFTGQDFDKLKLQTTIPIGDDDVICNGCNGNIYDPEKDTFGYLIYFGIRNLKTSHSYDFYCEECVKKQFPTAIEVKANICITCPQLGKCPNIGGE